MSEQLFVGRRPTPKAIVPVGNAPGPKPYGGLWTSDLEVDMNGPTSAWIRHCRKVGRPEWTDPSWWLLIPAQSSRTLVVAGQRSIERLLEEYGTGSANAPVDWEKLAEEFDGVRVEVDALEMGPFVSWDVPSTVWFTWVFARPVCLRSGIA